MKNLITLLTIVFLTSTSYAQIQSQGHPFEWQVKNAPPIDITFYKTPALDMTSIIAEDEVVDQYKETPYRFGIDREVNYNLFDFGSSTSLKNGDLLWRMGIHCPDATSINLIFGEYNIPEGGVVYIWSADKKEYIGGFTHENNKDFGSLAVGLVHSDKIIIEYREPAERIGQASLVLTTITHGYRPVINKWEEDKGPFGSSGNCNMNVNCADGDPWQDEKRGVALILNGGSAWCTGSLINTTSQDGTPYFLTASHCNGDESNWVFYFNHEYEGCSSSGVAPTNQSISGAVEQATTAPSDAHLVLLSSDVPASYEPYYNGWDKSGVPVSSAVGIHHPAGDVKKLAFDDDPLTITAYSSNTEGDFDHWRIEAWERSTTTEGGSSGSPLFDQNHRIIGQLHGGAANCSNSINDWYGAMHSSWTTLSQFLDPTNSGVSTMDGFGPFDVTYNIDAMAGGVTNASASSCESVAFTPTFKLINNGINALTSATISYSYNGVAQLPIAWTGTLSQNDFELVSLAEMIPNIGSNDITVGIEIIGDENAQNNQSVNVFNGSSVEATGTQQINIEILMDDYGAEVTWELKNPLGTTVLSGGPYTTGTVETINESYDIPSDGDGCYTFTIYDSFGDGLCCGYGIGNYTISDVNGVLVSGGEYAEEETKIFSMTSDATPDDVVMSIKAFLQGPYQANGLMNDVVRSKSSFPLIEPYTALGYTHYNNGGGETINSSVLDVTGNNAIVDWIFVELRDGENPHIILSTQSALLQKDGDIVGTDGVSPIVFQGLTQTQVYLVIRHRNHLAARTLNSYPTSALTIDLSNPSIEFFGIQPIAQLDGRQMLYSGDANRDGTVNTGDKIEYWRLQNGVAYDYFDSSADFDLNGEVNPIDKNDFWRLNNGKSEQLE